MNKLKTNILVIFSMVLTFGLSSCGGGGGGSTSTGDENPPTQTVQTVSVSGVATDGPIYGATVEIFAKTDTAFINVLGSATTSVENTTIGEYSITGIENLPAEYVVRVSGGKDAGPDGIKNDNDEESFEMLSVAKYSSGSASATVHISPATTLVAKLVENGKNIDTANQTIKTALGLASDVDLTKDNPKENDTANKAGTVIAQIINSIGVSDKGAVLDAIAKSFQEKNTKLVDISDIEVNVDDVDFGDIADKIKATNGDAISDAQIEKMKNTQTTTLMKKMVKNTTQKIKAVNLLNKDDKTSAIAAHKASLQMRQIIQDTDLSSLDTDKLSNNYDAIETGFATLIDSDIANLTTDNFDIVANVIMDNKTTDTAKIKSIAIKTKEIKGDKKQLMKQIYSSVGASEFDKIDSMDLSDFDSLIIDNTDNSFDEIAKEDIYKMAAIKLTSELKTKEVSAISVGDIASKTTKNEVLKTKIKAIAENKKQGNNEQVRADKLSLDNLEKNFTKDSFEFDENAKTNLEALEVQTKDKITAILSGDKSLEEIFREIKKLEIATRLQKLDNFDASSFDSDIGSVDNLLGGFYDNKQEDSDVFESISEIEEQIYTKIDNGDDLSDIIGDINTNIDDYIKERDTSIKMPNMHLPPMIGGFDFSSLMD
jgi:hypothetical protein